MPVARRTACPSGSAADNQSLPIVCGCTTSRIPPTSASAQRALPRRRDEREQPIADGEPAESQPLLLGLEVELLGGALALELALEVVEQAVPPHPAHDNRASRHPIGLSTAAELAIDRFRWRWFTIDYRPRTGVDHSSQPKVSAVASALPIEVPETSRAVPNQHPPPQRPPRLRVTTDEYFGQQPTPTASLPTPEPLIENLTRCVIEILAGARDLEQISRWVTDDVYRHLLKRVVLSTRARQAKGQVATPADVLARLAHDVRTPGWRGRVRRHRARAGPQPRGRDPARGAGSALARDRDSCPVARRSPPGARRPRDVTSAVATSLGPVSKHVALSIV